MRDGTVNQKRGGVTFESRVILFTDAHSFSVAFSRLDSEAGFLQDMYQLLGGVVVAHGGEIVKYLGDGVLCMFAGECEAAAVDCALQMRKTFADLAEGWGLPSRVELEVGVASGETGVGEFGHPSLRQRDVIGAAVNLAARIGHYRGVAVTEQVRDAIVSEFEVRRLPDLDLRQREEPLKVWEVVSRR